MGPFFDVINLFLGGRSASLCRSSGGSCELVSTAFDLHLNQKSISKQ